MIIPLAVIEDIIDTSGVAPRIEKMLPAGVRHRQLTASALLAGMMLTLADDRLTALPAGDQARPGVTGEWKNGPHQLTYRQVERTFHLVIQALKKDHPDGAPSDALTSVCDDLLEASIPARYKDASAALAVDWTDAETWSRPPRHGTTGCADPEASWGHRNSNLPGPKGRAVLRLLRLGRHHDPRGNRKPRNVTSRSAQRVRIHPLERVNFQTVLTQTLGQSP